MGRELLIEQWHREGKRLREADFCVASHLRGFGAARCGTLREGWWYEADEEAHTGNADEPYA